MEPIRQFGYFAKQEFNIILCFETGFLNWTQNVQQVDELEGENGNMFW